MNSKEKWQKMLAKDVGIAIAVNQHRRIDRKSGEKQDDD